MIIILVKILLLFSFGTILYQDIKERRVYWFLFPMVGVTTGVLYFLETLPELFLSSAIVNAMVVAVLMGVLFLYSRFKLKTAINKIIGLGDVLFLFAMIFGFASVSFMVLLPCALLFSLILHLVVSREKNATVPLAGYMSLFYGITFLGFWTEVIQSLYQI